MLFEEVKTPFKWYDSISKKQEYKQVCIGSGRYKLISPVDALLPFQIRRPATEAVAYTWIIKDDAGDVVETLDAGLLQLFYFSYWNYIIYSGEAIDGLVLPCGFYTSEISDGDNTWYSETFYVTSKIKGKNVVRNYNFVSGWANWERVGGSLKVSLPTGAVYGVVHEVSATLTQANILEKNTLYELTIVLTNNGATDLLVYLGGSDPGDGTLLSVDRSGTVNMCGYTEDGTDLFIDATYWEGTIFSITLKPVKQTMKLEWSNCASVGGIYYGTSGFKNVFYFDPQTEVVQNNPAVIREGFETGNKEFVQTWSKRQTVYSILAGLLPGYIIDALFEMQMHDTITLYINDNTSGKIKEVEVSPSWNTDGALCTAETLINFQVEDTILSGCCVEDELYNTCFMDCVIDLNVLTLFDPGVSLVYVAMDGVVLAQSFFPNLFLSDIVIMQAELNAQLPGAWTVVNDAGVITITVEQVMPTAHVFASFAVYSYSYGGRWLPFVNRDCSDISFPMCDYSVVIDVSGYGGAAFWKGFSVTMANFGPQTFNLPGTILLGNTAGLETALNNLGVGVWSVSAVGSMVSISVTQPFPIAYAFGDFMVNDGVSSIDIYEMVSDC